MEADSGNANTYRAEMQTAVTQAYPIVSKGIGAVPVLGPALSAGDGRGAEVPRTADR